MTDPVKKYTPAGLTLIQIKAWINRVNPNGFDNTKSYIDNLEELITLFKSISSKRNKDIIKE